MEQGHQNDTAGADVSDCQEDVCDELEERRRAFLAALQDDTAPVQPPLTDANGMLLEEPLRGEPAVAPAVPLNRHQRRARQRMLDRKLRRAK